MNKEEILAKAQKEEKDEMEQAILTKALGFSTIIIPILCLIFILIRILFSKYEISDLIVITLAQLTISEFYQYLKMKKKILLIIGVITLILSIIFMWTFINEVRV